MLLALKCSRSFDPCSRNFQQSSRSFFSLSRFLTSVGKLMSPLTIPLVNNVKSAVIVLELSVWFVGVD